MKLVINDEKKETIDISKIDEGLNYIVAVNKKDPFRWSRVLRFLGKGSAFRDKYFTWVLLFSEHLTLSATDPRYNRDNIFPTKKEAVEHYMSLNTENVIMSFRDENEFIEYLKKSI